jgi:hypothetical protein
MMLWLSAAQGLLQHMLQLTADVGGGGSGYAGGGGGSGGVATLAVGCTSASLVSGAGGLVMVLMQGLAVEALSAVVLATVNPDRPASQRANWFDSVDVFV